MSLYYFTILVVFIYFKSSYSALCAFTCFLLLLSIVYMDLRTIMLTLCVIYSMRDLVCDITVREAQSCDMRHIM